MKNILVLSLVLFTYTVSSKGGIIDFKQKKELKTDEGLLVLVIDINFRIAKISVAKEGKTFPVYSMKKLKPGSQMKIIKLKEGKYYWKEGKGYSTNTIHTFTMEKDITSFEVKAGKLNYPGTLQFRGWQEPSGDIVFDYNMLNNSTDLFVSLKEKFEELLSKYPLVYSGNNPDPFLEYNNELDNQ